MKPKFKLGQKVQIIKGFHTPNGEDNRDVRKTGTISYIWNFQNKSINYYDVHLQGIGVDFTYQEESLKLIKGGK